MAERKAAAQRKTTAKTKAPAKTSAKPPARKTNRKKPRGITPARRLQRDAKIIVMRARRVIWAEIAAEVGLTVSQCIRIRNAYLDDQFEALLDTDTQALVMEVLEELESIASRMSKVATTATDSPSQIGASRVQLTALRERIAVLQSLGLLPHSLGTIYHKHDFDLIFQKIIEVLAAHGTPKQVYRDIEQVARGETPKTLAPVA